MRKPCLDVGVEVCYLIDDQIAFIQVEASTTGIACTDKVNCNKTSVSIFKSSSLMTEREIFFTAEI